jgi:hypothetical protein
MYKYVILLIEWYYFKFYVISLSFDSSSKIIRILYNLQWFHVDGLLFYIIYNGSMLTVFYELSNNNEIILNLKHYQYN